MRAEILERKSLRMKYHYILMLGVMVGLMGCSSKSSGTSCNAVGEDYSMCDLTVKTNRLEHRVDNKDQRIMDLESSVSRQEQMLLDMNQTLYKQSKIAANLIKVAYAQRKMAEQLQNGKSASSEPVARQVNVRKNPPIPQKATPEMTITSSSPDQKSQQYDFKEESMTPSAFKFTRNGGIYDAPRGALVENWSEGEKFTAVSRAADWIRISGYFVKGEWTKMRETRWVNQRDIVKIR